MRALISFILLISVAASGARYLQGERERLSLNPSIAYWHEKLPTTPIPKSLWELISPDNEGKEGVIRLMQEAEAENSPDERPFRYHYGEDERPDADADERPFRYHYGPVADADERPFRYHYGEDERPDADADERPFRYHYGPVADADERPFRYHYGEDERPDADADERPFRYHYGPVADADERPFRYHYGEDERPDADADERPFRYHYGPVADADERPFRYHYGPVADADERPFRYHYGEDERPDADADERPFRYHYGPVADADERRFRYHYGEDERPDANADERHFRYHYGPVADADERRFRYHYGEDERPDADDRRFRARYSAFLLEKDLVSGTRKYLSFSQKMPKFLPRSVADEIPFSSDKISAVLKELNITPDSVMGLAMKKNLQDCEAPGVKGETKYCATSLESMIDYITSKLGSNGITVLATNVPKTSKSVKHKYSITGVKYESQGEKPVYVCHTMKYPYAVYYCHELQGTKAARVWVKGEDGSTVEAPTLCHTDTSGWSPKHMAFQLLNVKPGAATVCHFIPENDFVWLGAN